MHGKNGTRPPYPPGASAFSMETVFCVDCLEDVLRIHGKPEVFNSDHGLTVHQRALHGRSQARGHHHSSMDGRGRAFDNIFVERVWRSVKHEDMYLNGYSAMGELLVSLSNYFAFYNGERPHQALENQPPGVVYRNASGGGAMIVDKYGAAQGLPIALRSTGTALDEDRLEISGVPNAKNRGSAVQLCVQSSAT